MDRRRRQWIPVDVDLFSGSGRAAYEQFGHAGLVVWIAFLTACQKANVQGQLHWRSENEALVKMGLDGYDLPFSLVTFFSWTGRKHWTTTKAKDGVQTTTARRWDDWQPRQHRRTNETPQPRSEPMKRAPKGRKKGSDKAREGLPTSPHQRGGTPLKGVPPPTGGNGARPLDAADPAPAADEEITREEGRRLLAEFKARSDAARYSSVRNTRPSARGTA